MLMPINKFLCIVLCSCKCFALCSVSLLFTFFVDIFLTLVTENYIKKYVLCIVVLNNEMFDLG